ncbi:potassium-transporting ATPase subunit KdpA [Tistrella sp. BH-R2-4]|uniref:Potassium-transporting ATPase potassium-binding subunit n=1 Tax=Tistrella arctica TaxID=3133430 RepID=A0ABU9YJB4_9PROT
MTSIDLARIAIYLAIVTGLAVLLGRWLVVAAGPRAAAARIPLIGAAEAGILRLAGVGPGRETGWLGYALAVIAFNYAGFLLLYGVLRLQHLLPWNPLDIGPMAPAVAFNTAISFVTNTNWQAYSGEAELTSFAQAVGLGTQNFLSAATGIAVMVALARGFARAEATTLGDFTTDLTRITLRLLLPLAAIVAVLLVLQGVPQVMQGVLHSIGLDGGAQTIPLGPVASQVAIKQLGTNGGGFYGVNSAHPLENPTIWSNLIEMVAILALPAAMPLAFGRLIGDPRQGRALFLAMLIPFMVMVGLIVWAELAGNPIHQALGVDPAMGNMEGKEVRFGAVDSGIWAAATTAASNGSVNAMHDSFTPLGGMVAMLGMLLGEVIFGGVGSGLYGLILFAVIAVFAAGLMVGRTPEYLGKKIEAREMTLAMLALIGLAVAMLVPAALTAVLPVAAAAVQEAGPHGLSEILYAYGSAAGNNGSAFAGFGAAQTFHAIAIGVSMMIGRYLPVLVVLAIAGSLAAKKRLPATAGTLPTHGPLFIGLLIAVVLIIGGLTYFPALALGPVAEHLAMLAGRLS